MSFDTAATIINDAAAELGLGTSDDPYGDTNQVMVQLCALLKSLGREICREKTWTYLLKEYTFATVAGTSLYSLPADFRSMVNQSGWDRTARLPLGGPLSSSEWQYVSAVQPGLTFLVLFRPLQGQLEIYGGASVPDAHTIAFEYESSFWVTPNGQAAPTADAPTAKDDVLNLDSHLLSRGLIHKFKQAKGFDTTSSMDDYLRALEAAKAQDSSAPMIQVGSHRVVGLEPTLSVGNIPWTGFGS